MVCNILGGKWTGTLRCQLTWLWSVDVSHLGKMRIHMWEGGDSLLILAIGAPVVVTRVKVLLSSLKEEGTIISGPIPIMAVMAYSRRYFPLGNTRWCFLHAIFLLELTLSSGISLYNKPVKTATIFMWVHFTFVGSKRVCAFAGSPAGFSGTSLSSASLSSSRSGTSEDIIAKAYVLRLLASPGSRQISWYVVSVYPGSSKHAAKKCAVLVFLLRPRDSRDRCFLIGAHLVWVWRYG